MSALFNSKEFEILSLEVNEQFAWAADEGELNPESVAFITRGKLVSGHTRSRRGKDCPTVTAITAAQHYFEDQFNGAAGDLTLPRAVLVKTKIREDGVTPRQPSPALLRDLRALADGKQVELVVLGPPEGKGLKMTLNAPEAAPGK